MSEIEPIDNPREPITAGPEPPPRASGSRFGPSPGVRTTIDEMTVRMDTVVEAAERAAQIIRYDAEEQARKHLYEAQRQADRMTEERVRLISQLSDELIQYAGEVRNRSEQMIGALEQAINSVGGAVTAPAAQPAFHLRGSDEGTQVPAEAIDYVIRLASAGYEREAISSALFEYFGITDPAPLVDRMLGPR